MAWRPASRRPEYSDQPLAGFKLAYPMLSADGTRAGFSGLTVGRGHVYLAVDDAICVQGGRHACPSRWCDCGFYCFHEPDQARDLACEPDHRHAVFMQVAASGRYRRYELGLRYARQRVRTVRLGRCDCGLPATVLADTGAGATGWRQLLPTCHGCVGARPRLEAGAFGRLAGHGVAVTHDTEPEPDLSTGSQVAILGAEMALLQARLDDLQARLDTLTHGDRPAPD